MDKGKTRTNPGPAPARDQGRSFAVAAVIGTSALLILALMAVGDESIRSAERPLVTVQEMRSPNADALVQNRAGQQAAGDTPGRRLGAGLVLSPRVIENRVAGYIVQPDSDGATLSEAKLKPGDMLIDLDGRPLEATRVGSLADELSLADSVEVTFQRNGQIFRRQISLDP